MRLLCCLLCFPIALSLELPRGAPFSKISLYQIGKTFTCLDGTSAIPWNKVNDDYCDCLDGSDEPGTSACTNGHFFCSDVQYKMSSIRSAFVNDGICDCCDGSDEYDGRTICTSTCGVLAAAVEQARAALKDEVERGRKLFAEYVEQLQIRKAKAEVQRAQEEEEARKAEEARANDPELHQPEAEPISPLSVPPGVEVLPETFPDSKTPPESVVERDPALNNVDTHDPGDEMEEHDGPTPTPPPPPTTTPAPNPVDYGPQGAFQMLDDLESCVEFSDQQYTYELCGLKEVYQKNIGQSGHGTSLGRWSGWIPDDRDPSNVNPYAVMVYSGGLSCWNGPSRSTKVHVRCSDKNKITSVSEPSRCEYIMQLLTPAACFDDAEVIFKRIHPN